MEARMGKELKRIFHILCLFSTLILVVWCLHEYNLDLDLSETGFKKYHETPDDIYPSITICTINPFLRSKYEPYIETSFPNTLSNQTSSLDIKDPDVLYAYKHLLQGNVMTVKRFNHLLETVLKLDYDEMSIHFNELISEVHLTFPVEQNYVDVMTYHFQGEDLVADPEIMEKLSKGSLF